MQYVEAKYVDDIDWAMPVVFTPYLQKAKERLPPTSSTEKDADTKSDSRRPSRQFVFGATLGTIVGVAALAVARRLPGRRRGDISMTASNGDTNPKE